MTEREGIQMDDLSKKGRRLVRRALNAGVNPGVVGQAVSDALDSTASRRLSLESRIGGGREVVNRRDLAGLRGIVLDTLAAKKEEAQSVTSERGIVGLLRDPMVRDVLRSEGFIIMERTRPRDINGGTGNPI